jgi:carbonic anhydrase
MQTRILKALTCVVVFAATGNAQAASTNSAIGHSTAVDGGVAVAGTTAAASGHASEPEASGKESSGGHGAHWGYSGTTGPDSWGRLAGDYHLCGAGTMQSPVDIAGGFSATGEPIVFDYRLTPLSIVHNGHSVQVNYQPGSGITVAGERYELLQFHFHTPSEHAVEGQQAAMEMHLVHKNAAGALAVVGVMMEAGSENPALREIWDRLPIEESAAKTHERVLINARDLLPADTGYYRYMGSLTTPPCSEGVNWYVLTHPIQAGIEQVSKFAKAAGPNNRPLQPKNHRLVLVPGAAD